MVITTSASKPFEKVFMDIVGPLNESHRGNSYILTLINNFSKFTWAFAMNDHEANTIAQHYGYSMCMSAWATWNSNDGLWY